MNEVLPNLFVGWVQIIEPQDALFGEDGFPIQQERMGEWSGQFVTTPSQEWPSRLEAEAVAVNVIDYAHDRTVYGRVFLTKRANIKGVIGYWFFDFRGVGEPVVFDGEMLP